MNSAGRQSVSLEELIALNDEIAALVRAGVPLELGLRNLQSTAGGALGDISASLASQMERGGTLSDALRSEEHRIPRLYRTVVDAGLRAGRLPAALEEVADYAHELVELRRLIGAALLYPLIVFALAYGLFLVFTIDLVERFRETYEVFRLPIHAPFRWLMWLSEHVAAWWWGPPSVVVGLTIWWMFTGRAQTLSLTGVSRPISWFPGVGRIGRYFQYANFANLLALLLEHHVPLGEGLRLSADATVDPQMQAAVHQFAEAVERGSDTSHIARGRPEMPLFVEWLFLPLRIFVPASATFPPFLHWVLCQASRGAVSVRLLRHGATFYRRRAVNLSNWFKLAFPLVAAFLIGGGITLLYGITLFGPLASLWKDLVVE